jgi:hypothetical protein
VLLATTPESADASPAPSLSAALVLLTAPVAQLALPMLASSTPLIPNKDACATTASTNQAASACLVPPDAPPAPSPLSALLAWPAATPDSTPPSTAPASMAPMKPTPQSVPPAPPNV